MAERRMFAKTIIDSDSFLDMPLSTQCLYFHLSMRADDDGFINNCKKIQRMLGCSDDDLKLLFAKSFIIPFDSGVVVIKHWKIHNYIRNDRYKETVYKDEKSSLAVKENGAYTLGIPTDNQTVYHLETQYRIGKDRLDKDIDIQPSDTLITETEIETDTSSSDCDCKTITKGKKKENDIIYSTYFENCNKLFEEGKIYTSKPVLAYGQIGKLIKNAREKELFSTEQIIQCINNAMYDKWILDKGYQLNIILSGSQLQKLINVKTKQETNTSVFMGALISDEELKSRQEIWNRIYGESKNE